MERRLTDTEYYKVLGEHYWIVQVVDKIMDDLIDAWSEGYNDSTRRKLIEIIYCYWKTQQ